MSVVVSARSTFYRCRRSDTDPRFPKYPTLPVVACIGFEPQETDRSGRGSEHPNSRE